jgi:hypothetical protein
MEWVVSIGVGSRRGRNDFSLTREIRTLQRRGAKFVLLHSYGSIYECGNPRTYI